MQQGYFVLEAFLSEAILSKVPLRKLWVFSRKRFLSGGGIYPPLKKSMNLPFTYKKLQCREEPYRSKSKQAPSLHTEREREAVIMICMTCIVNSILIIENARLWSKLKIENKSWHSFIGLIQIKKKDKWRIYNNSIV